MDDACGKKWGTFWVLGKSISLLWEYSERGNKTLWIKEQIAMATDKSIEETEEVLGKRGFVFQ